MSAAQRSIAEATAALRGADLGAVLAEVSYIAEPLAAWPDHVRERVAALRAGGAPPAAVMVYLAGLAVGAEEAETGAFFFGLARGLDDHGATWAQWDEAIAKGRR